MSKRASKKGGLDGESGGLTSLGRDRNGSVLLFGAFTFTGRSLLSVDLPDVGLDEPGEVGRLIFAGVPVPVPGAVAIATISSSLVLTSSQSSPIAASCDCALPSSSRDVPASLADRTDCKRLDMNGCARWMGRLMVRRTS